MMKIDRHNYEEFFILYWDDELTALQKQAVENFVKENTDLQEEFKILGDTRFTPDKNVQLEEKEFLLNNSFINITNYEEQLLNYIDDELGIDERKEVERSAAKYPTIQKELALLQKTKLQPDAAVIFPDKTTLYRREEKVRVISMTWFRVAVAAAIILITGFVTLRLVNTNKSGDIPSVTNINESKDQPSNNKTEQLVAQPEDQAQKDKEQNLATTDDRSLQEQKAKRPDNKNTVKEKKSSGSLIAYKRENKNNLPKERKNIQQNDQNITTDGIIADADLPNLKKDNSRAQKNNSDAINTSFGETDVTLQAKPTLYIPVPEEKEKGGLKELLRKTTRVFERRTKIQATTEDNKLLVGAFAVSLK